MEVLREIPYSCLFQLLQSTTFLCIWLLPSPYSQYWISSGCSDFHCGWRINVSRKRFLVQNTNKTWDQEMKLQKISEGGNYYDPLELESVLSDWFNTVWRGGMSKTTISEVYVATNNKWDHKAKQIWMRVFFHF